ncbi:DNA-binding response regulator [Pusillimonas sp.]|uniref:response regulator transcription factor n=1 Tax=Pusillimonas sp. TaxID=3040095 RepID=UPI0029ACBA3E|nr:DNA-binding response regulator [Pusillimonas sp.]MDX3895897.1 DNA-binding response regulator [Pusillimonas sp.]
MPALRILLIDNNPQQLRPLIEALKEQGYRPTVAYDGSMGYARAVAALPDVILLESQLPKMDGLTLARMLTANVQTEHIPLLFLSESAAPEMRLAGLRAGAVDYIAKPFEPAEVIERIDIHTRLASRRAPAVERAAGDGAGHGDAKPGEAAAPQYEARKSARRGAYHHDDVLFSAIRRIVLEELEHPPSAAELAKSLSVSQHRLASVIKAQTGASLFEFVRGKRMEKASRLLVRTGLSVTDIAAEVGYSSAANFTTAFRDYFGLTPTAYRKNRPSR